MLKDLIVKINVNYVEINLNNPLNRSKIKKSTGTGFFIKNNFILTCYHVIKDNNKITINHRLTKKQNLNVIVHSIYPDDDLAVLYFENDKYGINIPHNIPFKILNELPTDDNNTVVVYGFPLNSNNIKTTKGIISGFHKSFFETDATLNPGNSGGPLIWNNKIIGINASKISSKEVDNVGFAIPIRKFIIYKNTIDEGINDKIYFKPKLNLEYQIIDKDQISKFNIPGNYGVRILKIKEDSHFDNCDIKYGDFILEFDGKPVDIFGDIEIEDFPEKINIEEIMNWYYVGQEVNIKYYSVKNNQIIDCNITLNNKRLIADYYKNYTNNFFVKKNNIIFSIITNEHVENIEKLDIDFESKLYLMKNILDFKNCCYIYVVTQIPIRDNFLLPEGRFIKNINNIEVNCLNHLKSLDIIETIEFINGDKFFLN